LIESHAMAFIHLDSNRPDVLLGAWQIEEDEIFFLTRLKLYENEWKKLATIKHANRRLEWLSSRLCIKELLKIGHKDRIESLSEANGKPYLSNHPFNISFTHSHKYSAAIAAPSGKVGIDIEYLGRQRNRRTSYLFMNEQELAYYEAEPSQQRFILIWSAKETLYKSYGQRGLSFRQHIATQVDHFHIDKEGILPAIIDKDGTQRNYAIYYKIFPEFILTYTIDSIQESLQNV